MLLAASVLIGAIVSRRLTDSTTAALMAEAKEKPAIIHKPAFFRNACRVKPSAATAACTGFLTFGVSGNLSNAGSSA